MEFTKSEFYNLCGKSDFIPLDTLEKFKQKLEPLTFSVGLEKFLMTNCVKCKEPGAFKWHFFGKLRHSPDCGWAWYVSPGSYIAEQFRGAFRAGAEMGGSMSADAEKKEGKKGYVELIFGFLFGSFFRLVFGLLMTPIQAIVSLTQSKPTETETDIKKKAAGN